MPAGVAEDFFSEVARLAIAAQLGDAILDGFDIQSLMANQLLQQVIERQQIKIGELHGKRRGRDLPMSLENQLSQSCRQSPLIFDQVPYDSFGPLVTTVGTVV